VSREARGATNEKLNVSVEKGEKGNTAFPDPAYIRSSNIGRPVPSGMRPPYIGRFPVKIDEYNFEYIYRYR
jgi:hypothetical protein